MPPDRAARNRGFLSFLILMLGGIGTAHAHGWIFPQQDVWSAWQLNPTVTVPVLVLVLVYLAGARRSRDMGHPIPMGRHILFFVGLGLVYLGLQSPLDPMADRLFLAHQIEHLLLRMLGPMFLVLAVPAVPLLRGLPGWAKRQIVKPVIRSRGARMLFAVLSNPYVATALFLGTLYGWQIPAAHDAAILDDPLHDLMHVTMLLSGLFFFWVILDFRPRVARTPVWLRFVLLAIVLVLNILLGSYLTLKQQVLYPAYDLWGRLWGVAPLEDESWGGLVVWIPSSMMLVVNAIIVFFRMLQHDPDRPPSGRHVP